MANGAVFPLDKPEEEERGGVLEEYLRRYAGWLQLQVENGLIPDWQANAKLRMAGREGRVLVMTRESFEKLPDYRLVMTPYPGEQQAWVRYWQAQETKSPEEVEARRAEVLKFQVGHYEWQQDRARQAAMAKRAEEREQEARARVPEIEEARFGEFIGGLPRTTATMAAVPGIAEARETWAEELWRIQEKRRSLQVAAKRTETAPLGAIRVGGVLPSAEAQRRATALMEEPETYAAKYGEAGVQWREAAEDIYTQRTALVKKAKKAAKYQAPKPRDPWEAYLEQQTTAKGAIAAKAAAPSGIDWTRYRPRAKWRM